MMIQLSDHFDYRRLLRFTLPSIIMMVFTSIYGVVDGFFVSNFAGKTVGFMFGTGGSALIALNLGMGDRKKADAVFSLVVYTAAVCGLVFALLGFWFVRPVAVLMGAEEQLLRDSISYARICLLALPFFILQFEFQCLFATAEKPKLGLYVTVASGVTNMILDALFVAVFQWGLQGAAAATALSQFVGGVIPLWYCGRSVSMDPLN